MNLTSNVPHEAAPGWLRRLGIGLVSLWLFVMTAGYVWVTASSLRSALLKFSPNFRPKAELAVLCAASLIVAGVLITHWRWRRWLTTSYWLSGLAGIGLMLALTTRQFFSVLIMIWLLALAYAWGNTLTARCGGTLAAATAETFCLNVSLGFTWLALIALGLGLAHLLAPKWIWVALLVLTLGQARNLSGLWQSARSGLAQLQEKSRTPFAFPEQGVLLVVLGLLILFNFCLALLPEIRFDALNYQLAVPRMYLEHQQIVHLPDFWHSYFARLVNLLFAIALGLQGPILAKLIVLTSSLVTLAGVVALANRLLNPRAALWSAALFYATPLASWIATTTYVDMPLTMFLTASLLAFLRWQDTKTMGWLWCSGLLAGAALATKPTAFYALVIISLMLVAWLLKPSPPTFTKRLGSVAGYACCLLLVAAPLYLITYRYTGNPVFPLFNGIFKSPGWEPVNERFNADLFGVGTSWTALLRLPFVFTFQSDRFDETNPPGSFGLLLLLAPLGLWLYKTKPKLVTMLFATCGIYLLLWATSFQYGRYYAPLLPLIVVLAVGGVMNVPLTRRLAHGRVLILGILLIAQCVLLPLVNGDVLIKRPLRVWLGLESSEAFLARALLGYSAANFLNHHTNPGERIATSGTDALRYYVQAPLDSFVETRELQRLLGTTPENNLAAAMFKRGYRYLWVNNFDPFTRHPVNTFLQPAFLARHATLVYSRAYTRVYRLYENEPPPPSLNAENLLADPGFEETGQPAKPSPWTPIGPPLLASNAHSGHVAACAEREDGWWQEVTVTAEQLYSLTGFERAEQTGQFAHLLIKWFDAKQKLIDTDAEVVAVEARWEWHKLTATAPPNARRARIHLYGYQSKRVCFDDLRFQRGDTNYTKN